MKVALGGPQLGFVESEIVPDFVDDRGLDLVANLVFGRGIAFQRLLEDENHVRRDVPEIRIPPVQGNAVVQAEKVPRRAEVHVLHDFAGREVLDQDGDVLDPVAEFFRQAVEGLGDELFEIFPGQRDHGRIVFLS